jgi:hypothetical protein
MKYLMTYESMTNYKVEVLTGKEFNELYLKLYPRQKVNLKDKIHYFDWSFDNGFGDKKHNDSIRLITAYNEKDILGICFFAWWSSGDHYSVSYLSTNKDYFNMGISKRLLDVLFKYFSETYPDEIMYWSGYSIEGWKYLHPSIVQMSKKYNVKLREKAIEFFKGWSDETRELVDKSKEEIKKLYPEWYNMVYDYGVFEK